MGGLPVSALAQGATVVRVGELSVSTADFEQRLATTSGPQLRALGSNDHEIKQKFLERVLVPELLWEQQANALLLRTRGDIRLRLRDAFRSALLRAATTELSPGLPSENDEISRYFTENIHRFQTPERLQLWRILVSTKEEAQQILDEARKNGTEKAWTELARGRSQDKATAERSGNLGFVRANGQTDEPVVRVLPALYEAAQRVKDGEMVREVVPEGASFAVLWRRGTVHATHQTLAQASPAIRHILTRQRFENHIHRLLEILRAQHVSELSADVVEVLNVRTMGPTAPSATTKNVSLRSDVSARPQPSAMPNGLR